MEKIVVNIDALEEFKTNFIKSNLKIMNIYNDMSDTVYNYSECMISDASEKFKELMIQKLKEEIDMLGNTGKDFEDKLNILIKKYSETYDEIKRNVGE